MNYELIIEALEIAIGEFEYEGEMRKAEIVLEYAKKLNAKMTEGKGK